LRRALLLDGLTVLRLALLCVALQPAVFAWALCQLTWILLWLVTRAWLNADRPVRAGAWLGVGIAIKPPLALMAVLLAWPIVLTAGSIAAAISLAAVVVTGWSPWREWWQLNHAVSWLSLRPNASLWGVAARIESRRLPAVHLGDIPWYSML